MSAAEAAALLGVRPSTYRAAENGGAMVSETEMVARAIRKHDGLPEVPTMPEACALARRRSGLAPMGVCSGLNNLPRYRGWLSGPVSKVTLGSWEMAADERLVSYWEMLGYSFEGISRT